MIAVQEMQVSVSAEWWSEHVGPLTYHETPHDFVNHAILRLLRFEQVRASFRVDDNTRVIASFAR